MPPQPKIDINLSSKDFADLMEKKENNSPKCPKCDSNEHVVLIKTFTKAGAVVGGVAGAAGAAGGAAAGAAIGSVVPIVGTAIGGILGGTLGWLAGGAAGATAGGGAGRAIDGIRDRYQCNKCGAEFDG
ncbi:MAG: hypothetical protein MR782_07000 [Campylobacter sp.]|nr:hypothetical protein [Campylobacter sp.]